MVRPIEEKREYNRTWQERNRPRMNLYSLWFNCKWRAEKKDIEFTLTRDDIKIPEFCPILHIKLEHGFKQGRDNSPSVDRIDLNRGYTPDNIQVISYLANRMKNNATIEQCVLLGKWAERKLIEISADS